ncbi:DUF2442 domain-containing protein [uncultured Nitrosomonas sp.]|uniref:DUF2442 domain-containing protein n=1 Tax=uncultured Nitrosomonas sp. TaxID=156424 RepID=UPI002625F1BE|nr:DUF2442 domain-containing protein [uncultured Nitrosomonas sp.]
MTTLFDVTAASALPGRRLQLRFEDGLQGTVCLDQIIEHYGGIFAPLLEDTFFKQVKVDPNLGTVVWPNGADICPTRLYECLQATLMQNEKTLP